MEIDLLAGVETWVVPAATLGVPGLLLLLWVALQAVGALAWIPAVRRLRGDEDERPARITADQPIGVFASHSSRNFRTSARKKPTCAPSSTR